MTKKRGEQRFASITYSQLARWTGLQLSTVRNYGAGGRIPVNDLHAVLKWVDRYCGDQKRPKPWEGLTKLQDRFARELGFWCYKDYLKSDLWQVIRSRILPCKCRHCDSEANCVHHHQYRRENMAGDDTKQLIPLCYPCHLKAHLFNTEDIYDPPDPSSPTTETATRQINVDEDSNPPAKPPQPHPASCKCSRCYQASKASKA